MHWSATKWRLLDFCPFGVWDSLCGTCSGDRDDHDDLDFAGMIMTKKAGWLKCLLILLPVCSVTLCESLTLLDQLSAGVFFCTAVLTHKKPLKHLARSAAGANAFIFSPIILHMLGIPWVSSKQLNIYWVIVLSSFYGTEDVLKEAQKESSWVDSSWWWWWWWWWWSETSWKWRKRVQPGGSRLSHRVCSDMCSCFCHLWTNRYLREGSRYQIGWFIGKIPYGFWPPPLIFGKLYCYFFNFILKKPC